VKRPQSALNASSPGSATADPWDSLCQEIDAVFGPADAPGQAPPLPPRAWAEAYRRIDDQPFSLDRYAPLQEPYDDDHPFQVYRKCAQVGVSEMAITKACHALDAGARYWQTGKSGLNVAYLFPTGAALSDFSKERFSSLKDESVYLAKLFDGSPYDDVGFKQVGASYLYLRGTHSKKSLKSFPADILILDEYDEMDPTAVAMADKRLRASVVKRKIALSTPLLPGLGIDALYAQSDMRIWETHCPACDVWSELDFFRDVRVANADRAEWQHWDTERLLRGPITVHCPNCKRTIDRSGPGRWRAQRPDVTAIRGYHIPALAFPSVDLSALVQASVSTNPAQVAEFYRSDLGLPFEPAGSRITLAMLTQLSHALIGGALPSGPWRQTTMGVDVGARLHYRISSTGPDGARYIRAMGSVANWVELDRLIATYQVRRCVIDALPELHACKDWALGQHGKVARALYPNGMAGELVRTKIEKNDEGREIAGSEQVLINRTMAMDAVFHAVATAAEHWPVSIHNDTEVQAHMIAPIRVMAKNDQGQEQARWAHTAPDHLFHACVYDLIAFQTLPKGLPGLPLAQGRTKGWNPA